MERIIYTIALILLFPSCSGRFAAFFDRTWQRWNYPAMCHKDEALPGAFLDGLEYGAIIGGYRDTMPVYFRYTLRGWFVVQGHDREPVTASDILRN